MANEGKINIDELIIGDGTKIDAAIEKLTKLNGVFDVMVDHATQRAKEYAEALNGIQQAASDLEGQMKSLDVTSKKDQDTLAKGAGELEDLVGKNDAVTDSMQRTEKQIGVLLEQQKKLQDSQNKLGDSAQHQAGSLNDLREQLKKAEGEYKALGTASDQIVKDETLTKIKTLSRSIHDQETAMKNAKKGVDIAKGSYQELTHQVNKAKAELKQMEGGIGSNSEEFKKLQAFVKNGTEKLKEFDKAIGDNQRDVGNYEKAVEGLGTVGFGGLATFVKSTGKELLMLAKNPFFLMIAGIIGIIYGAAQAVKTFFTTTGQGEDILGKEKAVWEGFFFTIRKGFASIGEDIYDFFGGTKNILTAVLAQISPGLAAMFASTATVFEELEERSDALGDEIIQNIIDRAKSELDINKLLEKSKNTLLYSDEQRLTFLKQASTERERQAKREIELAQEEFRQLAEKTNFEQGSNELIDEQKKKLAEAAAKIIGLESQYFQEQKKNTAQIATLTQEIETRKRQAAERELDTRREINKAILSEEIKRNDEVLKHEESSLDDRINALLASDAARLKVLDEDKAHELDLIQRAAEERIRAEGKLVTDELLANDAALANQREIILLKYEALVLDTNEKLKEAVKDNFFKILARDSEIATAEITENLNYQLEALNQALLNGEVSLKDFNRDRLRLQHDAQKESLLSQLGYLKQQVDKTQDGTVAKAKLLEKISKLELDLSQVTTDEVIADMKQLEQEQKSLGARLQQLQQEAFAFAMTLVDAGVQRNIDSLTEQLDAQVKFKDERLKIVGDDKQAQALIELDFANKQAAIERQIAAEKRKAALFEKALNVSQIITNTATAVMKTLAEGGFLALPLSVVIGSIGALQLARTLSTPIPAYYTGVDASPEGYALLGDRYGRELAVGPDGSLTMYERPTVDYLAKNTRVFNNQETEKILDLLDADNNIQGNRRDALLLNGAAQVAGMNNKEVVAELQKTSREITDAIKSNQEYYDEYGYRRYELSRAGRIRRLDDKYRFSK
jgi:hypothetical protein